MDTRRTPVPARDRARTIAAALLLVSSVVVGCGPSQDEIRADIDEACRGLLRDLSGLQADPPYGQLALAADAEWEQADHDDEEEQRRQHIRAPAHGQRDIATEYARKDP